MWWVLCHKARAPLPIANITMSLPQRYAAHPLIGRLMSKVFKHPAITLSTMEISTAAFAALPCPSLGSCAKARWHSNSKVTHQTPEAVDQAPDVHGASPRAARHGQRANRALRLKLVPKALHRPDTHGHVVSTSLAGGGCACPAKSPAHNVPSGSRVVYRDTWLVLRACPLAKQPIQLAGILLTAGSRGSDADNCVDAWRQMSW